MMAVETTSLVDVAYENLLERITSFQVKAGAPLSEVKISKELNISRTPIREALQRLEKEGLVQRTESSRFTVAQISIKEVNEACDLLEILDTYIFTAASQKLSGDDAAELRRSITKMSEAVNRDDRPSWTEADRTFHQVLNRAAGNELVADTVRETRRRVQRFWIRSTVGQFDRLHTCTIEHSQLVDAIINKDIAAIGPAVTEHIGHLRENDVSLLTTVALLTGDDRA
jgi:DNA-binding GntR family transcriptional regulator